MNNKELAEEIVNRLNAIIKDQAVRFDVGNLLESSIPVSALTAAHPTLVVGPRGLGPLGLINGLLGSDARIVSHWTEEGDLLKFSVAEHTQKHF